MKRRGVEGVAAVSLTYFGWNVGSLGIYPIMLGSSSDSGEVCSKAVVTQRNRFGVKSLSRTCEIGKLCSFPHYSAGNGTAM